jgi:DNA invertase Pin-like site-specific DNA recombinase
MKVAGYIRVSTSGQVENGCSLEAQRAKIEAWALLHDATVVEIFVDEGISGHVGRDGRPGLDAALNYACYAKCPLVVYSMSRLARNTKETIEIGDCLAECGADLVSLSENIDTTSAAGKMVFQMLAVLAEFERNQVRERTKMALAHKKGLGQRVGGVPWGKELAADGKTLVDNPTELRMMERARELRQDGMAVRAIAAVLAEEGYTTKRGTPMTKSTVHELLSR